MLKKMFMLSLTVICYGNLNSQISIDNATYSTTQLVDGVLVPSGSGTVVSNVTYQGVYNNGGDYQVGYFSTTGTTQTELGFADGVVLSSGNTSDIPLTLGTDPGSVAQMSTGYFSSVPGEIRQSQDYILDLDILAGAPNYFNASILEFDFVPQQDFVQFRYVFGSEEYEDNGGFINYQCTSYNDKFGFLISGPGISGGEGYTNDAENIARLANGSEVGINSVNNGVVGSSATPNGASYCSSENPDWLENVSTAEFAGTIDGTQLNGNTIALTAYKGGLTPGQTYHIKLIVTDVNDGAYDAVVYLEAGSFITDVACTPPATPTGSLTQPDCITPTGSLTISSPTAANIQYSINGTDYQVSPSFDNLAPGDYNVTAQDMDESCISEIWQITIDPIPAGPSIDETNLAINDELCNGTLGTITGLSATGTNLTYSWTNGGGNAVDAINLTAGSYTLTVTDDNNCTETSGPHTVNYIAGPTVDETNLVIADENCGNGDGSITGITASGSGLTYSWDNGGGNALDASSLSSGDYTLTVTDGNNCTVTSGPHSVNNLGGPSINQTNLAVSNELCNGTLGTITGLTASGVGTLTYSWDNSAETTIDLSNLSQGSYTLTVTDQTTLCTATAGPFNVGFIAGPSVDETNLVITDELCNGTLGTITGISATGNNLTYSWTNGGGNAIDATSLTAGDYTLTVTDDNNCTTSSGPHTVNYVAGPTVDETNLVIADENCGNGDGSISGITAAGSGLTYSWDNGGGNALDASSLSSGDYTITVTDANNCTVTSGPHAVNNLGAPIIDETNLVVSDELCNGTLGSITGITATGVGTLTYSWDNSIETTIDLSNLSQGSFTLTVTDQTTMCSETSGPHNVNFVAGPSIDETNLSITDELCNGTLGTITGISATGNNLTYSWTNGGGNAVDATSLTAGDYTLTVTDENNCSETSGPHTVNYIAGPSIDETNVSISDVSCEGIGGTISGITASGSGLIYSWSNTTQTTLDVVNLNSGNFELTITDQNGCTVVSSIFTVNQEEVPFVDAGSDLTIESGESVDLTASGNGSIIWSTGESGNSITVSPESTTTYCVTAELNGCEATDCITVTVNYTCGELFVPTAFSPNGNGVNEGLKPLINPACVEYMNFRVYDRWGELVYSTDSIDDYWDGVYKGKELQTGAFVWTLKIKLSNEDEELLLKGNVELLR